MLSCVNLLLGRSLESRSCSSRTPQSGPPRSNVHCYARHRRPQPSHPQVLNSSWWFQLLLGTCNSRGKGLRGVASTAVHVCCRRTRICGVLGTAAVFANSTPAEDLRVTASMKPFSMMSCTHTAVYVVRITNANLSNTRPKMAWFVMIFE